VDATRILDAFYPGASAVGAQAGRARRLWSIMRKVKKSRSTARKWTPYLVIGSLLVAVWFVFHLYYYNLLVDMEYDVKANWAQVEVQLQRRYHIQQNLTQIVIDYSEYEKDTLTNLIEMRTSTMTGDRVAEAKDANQQSPSELSEKSLPDQLRQLTKSELDKLFPNILLVAEQYPELKLTENFQQFSGAIIDTESQIAGRITAYNDAVNTYTTTRTQFPGNMFAAMFGFPSHDFYTPDKELLDFKPVEY
jgi:LemA protein